MSLLEKMGALPLVAILRGVKPGEVEDITAMLTVSGFRAIEVPLNSPDPFDSIARLVKRFGDKCLIGAGTVTTVEQVNELAATGATLMVSPHTDVDVIRAAKAKGLYALPGFFTPSEAFAAIKAGADGLKLFPAEAASPAVLKGMMAVIPKHIPVFPVGGITPDRMKDYRAAGAAGFGLGGALYQPGQFAEMVAMKAHAFATAWTEK
ncbi:2-dehydro-3-deoxy-6-phosphogalactonate aldolase [Lacibacterium aquatile]|uniref:2-dehydro-3-deoxy-6-phosphogalactonate aldolase n=1 Tax=Lacibacterium aquatile TaxID=1168082 RepID=A0ABW5DTS1_9PROT